MPMSFPDMESLLFAAEAHQFRKPKEGETEAEFRNALADHVRAIDLLESNEIRTGKGWDQWTPQDMQELLKRRDTGRLR